MNISFYKTVKVIAGIFIVSCISGSSQIRMAIRPKLSAQDQIRERAKILPESNQKLVDSIVNIYHYIEVRTDVINDVNKSIVK